MASKICTTIEQSQQLIELGIDINTADMFWDVAEPNKRRKPTIGPISDYYDMDDWAVPAWSLSALMHLMPTHYVVEKCSDSYCCYNFSVKEFFANTAVDAAFDMVCWLLENKK